MEVSAAPAIDMAKEGDWALVVDNETRYSFAHVSTMATIRLGKKMISCAAFVGVEYGTYFEAINDKLVRTEPEDTKAAMTDLVGAEAEGTAAADNRDLYNHADVQGLTHEEITAMKEEGKKGELVRNLVLQSATFAKRTEYAQEKYIRKKSKKHQVIIQLLRPTAALIAKAYFHKKSWRTQHLRPDALAHIMTYANWQGGIRSLVIEDCIGVVLGAALERLGGHGKIYHLHQGLDTSPSALRLFNLTQEQMAPLNNIPIGLLRGALTAATLRVEEEKEDAASTKPEDDDPNEEDEDDNRHSKKKKIAKRINPAELPPKVKKKDQMTYAQIVAQEDAEGVTEEERAERKRKRHETRRLYRELKWQTLCDRRSDLEKRGVDSLVIAGLSHPLMALNSTWQYLNRSGNFVIYCEYLQPLVECYEALFDCGGVINMRLSESWFREYQVLPKRTHPKMMMAASSGYLLSGIKVEPPQHRADPSPAATAASSSAPKPKATPTAPQTAATSSTPSSTPSSAPQEASMDVPPNGDQEEDTTEAQEPPTKKAKLS